MRHRWVIGVAVIAVVMAFSSCQKREKGSRLNKLFTWETLSSYQMYVDPLVEERWSGEQENIPQCWVHVELLFPTVQDSKHSELQNELRKVLSERVTAIHLTSFSKEEAQATLDQYVANQIEDYKKDVEQAKELELDVASFSIFSRQVDLCDSLVFNQNGIISITLLAQEYSGGAHGNELLTTLNYDLERMQMITPSVLFQDPSSEGLAELILNSLMLEFDVEDPSQLEFLGVFNYTEIEVTNNFYFTPEGIAFYYNPYELAAYAVGAIELIVPYNELVPYFSNSYQRLGKI